jgi:hypothetical protein
MTDKSLVYASIFLIIVLVIGMFLVVSNINYFQGAQGIQGTQGIQGIAGINSLDFNSTIPYINLFNGTNGNNGIDFNSTLPYVYLYNGTNGLNGFILNQDVNTTGSPLFQALNIVGNIAINGTVDGVDVSGLLLKNVKVSDLGTIWDKSTKIGYGDTSFSNQNLLSSSNPTFSLGTFTGNLELIYGADNYIEIGTSYTSGSSATLHFTTIGATFEYGRIDTSGNLIMAGTLSGIGYINISPILSGGNPWLGTPTSTRSFNVIYHNLTGKTIIVYVSSSFTTGQLYYNLDHSSACTTTIGYFSSVGNSYMGTIIVPNGWYYEIILSGTVSLTFWFEQTL